MTYTLYLARGTVALAPHIALEEIGAPFDLVWVDFSAGEQRTPAFADINPKGRVPVLRTPEGHLTECPAILNYLAASHPGAQLWPEDAFARARIDEMSAFLASTVHVNHAHGPRAARWADTAEAQRAMGAKVPETMTDSAALLNAALDRSRDQGPWVLGARFSTADMHLFAVSRWMKPDGVDLGRFPALSAHMAAMSQRSAVQRVVDLHR